jgi:hypothetical protein
MASITIKELLEQHNINLDGIAVGDISDGYHSFNELYEQRLYLFAALVNTFPMISWKSHKHEDGEECFGGGWFIVGIDTPDGQYTYHYEDKYWDLFKCPELPVSKHWDGHTAKDVGRVMSLEKSSSQVRATLSGRRFINTDMSGIDCSNTVFYNCTFMNVDFRGGNLENAKFFKCNLCGVDLVDANIKGIDFVDSFLHDVKYEDSDIR